MIDNLDKNKCTGCSACYNICPKDAIIMKKDRAEFLFPEIDYDKCIKCNLCEKVCPSMSKFECLEDRFKEPIVKAAWSKDENIRINSTSGGLFSELAKGFLKETETFVVGAIYNKKFLVEHYITNKTKDLELLRQSKYVQSDKKMYLVK
ncbi:Formate hydrogenlyase subunit 6/NADH:ubiquinone oxidoreductase 23 kD subunit (chain I) [Megamonas hypermegale ART12/1]|nr:Formate hydrogenlyase subunit 6/NADH:ubiquinone oxidoreductase 23 kD subunit (chain I) [Megamonas hypermegale ART12/1]